MDIPMVLESNWWSSETKYPATSGTIYVLPMFDFWPLRLRNARWNHYNLKGSNISTNESTHDVHKWID